MGAALRVQVFVHDLQHDPVSNNFSCSSVMVTRSFSSFLQISSCCFFPCRAKYHTWSAWYCCTRILQGFSYRYDENQLALSANRKIFTIKLWWKSTALSAQGADAFPCLGALSLKVLPELRECNGCYWCSFSMTSHALRYYLLRNLLHNLVLGVTI